MSLRILHILDDEIFLNGIVDSFEKWNPGNNIYLVNAPENKILNNIDVPSLLNIAPFGSERYDRILLDFERYDVLFIHGYYQKYKYSLTEKVRNRKWIHVSFWGADIYGKIPGYPMYLPETNNINQSLTQEPSLKRQLKSAITKIAKYPFHAKKENDYGWIDSFSTVLLGEEELVRKALVGNKCRYYAFNYASALSSVDVSADIISQNLLIGNSANNTSNHLDMIRVLKELNLNRDRKLILPLGYGGTPEYKRVVSKSFEDSFYDQVRILSETQPFEEYLKILSSCSHALMPQLRQQAFGNVFLLINLGTKVFLYPENLLYKTLKDMGIKVYLMDELSEEIASREIPQIVDQNRKILRSYYNEDNFRRLTQTMLDDLAINISKYKNVSA